MRQGYPGLRSFAPRQLPRKRERRRGASLICSHPLGRPCVGRGPGQTPDHPNPQLRRPTARRLGRRTDETRDETQPSASTHSATSCGENACPARCRSSRPLIARPRSRCPMMSASFPGAGNVIQGNSDNRAYPVHPGMGPGWLVIGWSPGCGSRRLRAGPPPRPERFVSAGPVLSGGMVGSTARPAMTPASARSRPGGQGCAPVAMLRR